MHGYSYIIIHNSKTIYNHFMVMCNYREFDLEPAIFASISHIFTLEIGIPTISLVYLQDN